MPGDMRYNDLIAAIQAASKAGAYKLAMQLIREAGVDVCFICGRERPQYQQIYVYRDVNGEPTVFGGAREKRVLLGWVCPTHDHAINSFFKTSG